VIPSVSPDRVSGRDGHGECIISKAPVEEAVDDGSTNSGPIDGDSRFDVAGNLLGGAG
jgi:hypothetical protein